MLRVFQAGLIAAFLQAAAVAATMSAVALSARYGLIVPGSSTDRPAVDCPLVAVLPLLTWVYLLFALGIALTGHRFVDLTAARLRRAAHLMRPAAPERVTKTLLAQLSLAAVGFALLAFRSPPDLMVSAGRYIGMPDAAAIAWPGMMSIGAASFGANAQAARKALGIRRKTEPN